MLCAVAMVSKMVLMHLPMFEFQLEHELSLRNRPLLHSQTPPPGPLTGPRRRGTHRLQVAVWRNCSPPKSVQVHI